MLAAGKSLGNRSLTSTLEVERKFVPSALLKKYASDASTTPRISLIPATHHHRRATLTLLPRERVTDKYFDHKGQLEKKGIWVRWRKIQVLTHDGVETASPQAYWEAKVKQGGDFLDSQFVEAKGRDAVEALMVKAGVCDSVYNLEFELGFVADRVSWAVSGLEGEDSEEGTPAMTLVLDTMTAALEGRDGEHPESIHHQVGELELEKTVTASPLDDRDTNTAQADSMREKLASFMTAYPTISDVGAPPVGKITAYMQHKETLAARKNKANVTARVADMSKERYERLFGKN